MKTQQKIYVISASFLGVALLLAGFLAYPLWGDIKRGASDILIQKDKIANVELHNKALDDFKEHYEEYKPNLEKIDTLFVDAKDPIDFITFLEKAAVASNVGIDIRLSSFEEKKAGPWALALFQVTAKGEFANMMEFSQKLETGSYLTRIRKATMRKQDQDPSESKTAPPGIEADFLVEVVTK